MEGCCSNGFLEGLRVAVALASVCPSLGFCVQGVIDLQSNQFACVD